MLDHAVTGDLRERVDGNFEGWCWSPDRPEVRLVVDLLVNDTLAASIVAAVFRRDLQLRGIGDGRHAFVLRLPPNLPETDGEHIVTARERSSGIVIGRVMRGAGGAVPGAARLDAVTEAMAGLWQRLEVAREAGARASTPDRMRTAMGALAARLRARSQRRGFADSADPGLLLQGPPVVLPDLPAPILSVVLRAADAAATLRRLQALAPAAELAGAEFIAIDPGLDPSAALLPARVRNMRYLRDPAAATLAQAANLAATAARGRMLLLLGESVANPSGAALLALGHAAARGAASVLLGPAATASLARAGEILPTQSLRLRSRLGVALCVERALWPELGPLDSSLDDGAGLECVDLAFRAGLLGVEVRSVTEPAASAEPAAEPPERVAPAQIRRAVAAFSARWGQPLLEPPA
jgi:hypothetical protein